MGRKSGFIFALCIMMWLITACGTRHIEFVRIDPDQTSGLSDEGREQQYREIIKDLLEDAFGGMDGVDDIGVEITSDDEGVMDVRVKIDYFDRVADMETVNNSVEQALTKFLPEGTRLTVTGGMSDARVYDRFLDNELPAFPGIGGGTAVYYDDYCSSGFLDEEEYEISRLDLDNDGKEELVISSVGHYGAAVIDFRENTLYFLAQGEGTAGICSYTFIGDEAWIVHSDTSHGGRQIFVFEKFNGNGEVTDQFTLSAEYWEEPEGRYTENSDFTYRDEKITMQEYENLRMLYMGW